MTALTARRPPLRPLVVVIGAVAIAIGTQVAAAWPADRTGTEEPRLAAPPAAEAIDAGHAAGGRGRRRLASASGPPRPT